MYLKDFLYFCFMKIQLDNLNIFKLSGVYMIKNLKNKKIYIGSTKMSFKRRYLEHLRTLKINKHHNTYLNRAVKKYGIENFEFSVIEVINDSSILYIREREKFFINNLNSVKQGYNFSNITTSPPYNKESRNKISNTLKEKYKTDSIYRERLLKNSNNFKNKPSWNKGIKCSNISKARKELFDDIEVYDINMTFFRKFDNPIEIEKFSKLIDNDLPIPKSVKIFNPAANKFSIRDLKNKIVLATNIHRAIRKNIFYKGLFFKKIKRI